MQISSIGVSYGVQIGKRAEKQSIKPVERCKDVRNENYRLQEPFKRRNNKEDGGSE